MFRFMWAQAYVSNPNVQLETELVRPNNSDRSLLQRLVLTCWNGTSGDSFGSVWPPWALLLVNVVKATKRKSLYLSATNDLFNLQRLLPLRSEERVLKHRVNIPRRPLWQLMVVRCVLSFGNEKVELETQFLPLIQSRHRRSSQET